LLNQRLLARCVPESLRARFEINEPSLTQAAPGSCKRAPKRLRVSKLLAVDQSIRRRRSPVHMGTFCRAEIQSPRILSNKFISRKKTFLRSWQAKMTTSQDEVFAFYQWRDRTLGREIFRWKLPRLSLDFNDSARTRQLALRLKGRDRAGGGERSREGVLVPTDSRPGIFCHRRCLSHSANRMSGGAVFVVRLLVGNRTLRRPGT
jgi:hypothetical protein